MSLERHGQPVADDAVITVIIDGRWLKTFDHVEHNARQPSYRARASVNNSVVTSRGPQPEAHQVQKGVGRVTNTRPRLSHGRGLPAEKPGRLSALRAPADMAICGRRWNEGKTAL
jgi:hypothetical protein